MGEERSHLLAALDWLAMLPIYAAYRLVWLAALTRNHSAETVYLTMWLQYLDLPEIKRLTSALPTGAEQ